MPSDQLEQGLSTMSDEALAEDGSEAEDGGEDGGEDVEIEVKPAKGGLSGKKLVIFIVLPILLLGGGGAGLFFSGLLDSLLGISSGADMAAEEEVPGPAVFYDLPDMLVNLSPTGRTQSFLKLSVSLELGDPADTEMVESVLPRIVDSFQVYLRELRIEDLSGSAGLQRLREELLLRVNTVAEPTMVRDILFKELLVQ